MLCFLLDKISSRFKCHFVILNEYALIKKYWQQDVAQDKHCVDVFDKLYFGFLICYHLYWIIKNGICGKTNKSIECRFVSTTSTSCDHRQSLNINAIGRSPPPKPTKVTLFAIILYNLENSIRDIKPICRPIFCHSSAVKYASSLLQLRSC